eukprot:TRINITY_DN16673_c0_g2_i1.p1 TRINITY_DN16673_c0_g2~~TRINITY_DN16673_c0_g2_i1.p1  ORF type:complete len:385 (+),score=95.77 TRINITY_DN16673_c0_g2_i1:758-1912(+)
MPAVFKGRARGIGTYDVGAVIGKGTYGVVYKATDRTTGQVVALKRVKADEPGRGEGMPLTALREVGVLQEVQHENLVRLLGVAVGPCAEAPDVALGSVWWVFEHLPFDLEHIVDKVRYQFKPSEVKAVAQQLLQGVGALHARHLMHRDIKLANILYDNDGTVKICDYGLARPFETPPARSTPHVCTLWYRAPELLVGTRVYGGAVDIWSVGCVIGELFLGTPLLPGATEVEQLGLAFACLGAPDEAAAAAITAHVPTGAALLAAGQQRAQRSSRAALEAVLSSVSRETCPFLRRLLHYAPHRRPSAQRALADPYFDSMPYPANPSMMPTFDVNARATGAGRGPRQARRGPTPPKRARPGQETHGTKRRKLEKMLIAYDSDSDAS